MTEFDERTITAAVIGRLENCQDPRFKLVMTSMITHLHNFVREVQLTEAEWMQGLQFLTATGQKSTDKRQEFILLSDTLGVSILVISLNHPSKQGSSDSTVLGPFYWEGAPELPLGSNLAEGVSGDPTWYSGRVLDINGSPIKGATLDIWSGNGEGFYDMQLAEDTQMKARGRITTDAEGRYWFRSIRPVTYPIPTDGPVGTMLEKMARHPNRPGHIHMIVSAPGYAAVTTHLFMANTPYLDSDPVFGTKESLIINFQRHEPGKTAMGDVMNVPYYSAQFDFRLHRA
jgi:hydroxyquinol 1,2-dioxygenase